jgi:hypothetical protein
VSRPRTRFRGQSLNLNFVRLPPLKPDHIHRVLGWQTDMQANIDMDTDIDTDMDMDIGV